MNYYETLEVSPNASPAVIKAAYKSLMQRYHPDRNPDKSAAQQTILVGQAYEVLSDETKRAAYNAELQQALAAAATSAQRENRARHRQPARSNSSHGKTNTKDGNAYGMAWILILAAVVCSVGFFMHLRSKPSPEIELDQLRLSIDSGQLARQQLLEKLTRRDEILRAHPHLLASERMKADGARTVSIYLADLSASIPGSDGASAETAQTLRIPVMSVKVGSFDAKKMLLYLGDNKAAIRQKIEVQLASAKPAELTITSGRQYLQSLILETVNEAAGANILENYPASISESPGRYGVVEVDLPKSFSIVPGEKDRR